MEKVTVKDIKEIKQQLSLGTRISVSGKRAIKMPKRFYEAMKKWYKGKKEALYDYAASERKAQIEKSTTKINSEIERIDKKLDSKYDVYGKYADNEMFQEKGSKGYDYLEALSGTIDTLEAKKNQLADKKVRVSSKSFGLFRTSRLALAKLAKAKYNDIQQKIANRKEMKKERKEQESIVKDAFSLCGKVNSTKMKMGSIVKQYEELKKQLNVLQKQQDEFEKNFGMTPEQYINNMNLVEEVVPAEEVEEVSGKTRH